MCLSQSGSSYLKSPCKSHRGYSQCHTHLLQRQTKKIYIQYMTDCVSIQFYNILASLKRLGFLKSPDLRTFINSLKGGHFSDCVWCLYFLALAYGAHLLCGLGSCVSRPVQAGGNGLNVFLPTGVVSAEHTHHNTYTYKHTTHSRLC